MKIHIEIEGQPTPKGRPRFSRRSGHVYTTKKTRDAESTLKTKINLYKIENSLEMIFEPIDISITFFLRRPKYMSTKKYPDEKIPHTKKPDLDNLTKTVLDSLNGILIGDDSQIYRCQTIKYYTAKNENPKTIIEVEYEKNNNS